jgi:hypothetical protein
MREDWYVVPARFALKLSQAPDTPEVDDASEARLASLAETTPSPDDASASEPDASRPAPRENPRK